MGLYLKWFLPRFVYPLNIFFSKWVYPYNILSLTGCIRKVTDLFSDQTEIGHNSIKSNPGVLLQKLMFAVNLIPTTGMTEMYLALDTLIARPTRNWNFALSTCPEQVNLTILTNATFLAVFDLSNY